MFSRVSFENLIYYASLIRREKWDRQRSCEIFSCVLWKSKSVHNEVELQTFHKLKQLCRKSAGANEQHSSISPLISSIFTDFPQSMINENSNWLRKGSCNELVASHDYFFFFWLHFVPIHISNDEPFTMIDHDKSGWRFNSRRPTPNLPSKYDLVKANWSCFSKPRGCQTLMNRLMFLNEVLLLVFVFFSPNQLPFDFLNRLLT